MPLLGSHLSIAGGYYKAVEAAAALQMDCVQIFTKNNNQWKGKALTAEDVALFRDAIERTGIRMPCGHDSYLINLASPTESLWQQSLEAFVIEIERADALGLAGLVIHPGSRVDRHEHIGHGMIGKTGFIPFVRDEAFANVPKILETAKDKDPSGRDWDEVNLETLRAMLK